METNPASLGCTGSGLHPAAIVLHSEAGDYGSAVRVGVEVGEDAKAPVDSRQFPLTPSGFKTRFAG